MIKVEFPTLCKRIHRVLIAIGVEPARAALGARLVAEADRDGVRTHGIARLPRFATMVELRRIDATATPVCTVAGGALERWSGRGGPGNLAAHAMTERAIVLAQQYGIGAVALGDTTHWQRGGTYGWQAADAGFALLAWTNTMPNLPPWGATTPALGNNPLVVAVPHPTSPVVLDMAMSQFSYGALASYRSRGEALLVPGGFDGAGELTTDAAAIEATQRALPIGFWKGSGLAFVLDLLAAMLAGGNATHEIATDPLAEVGLSQVFIAIRPEAVESIAAMQQVVEGCVAALQAATPVTPGTRPRYPGEGTLRAREISLRDGVAMDERVWEAFMEMEARLGIADGSGLK